MLKICFFLIVILLSSCNHAKKKGDNQVGNNQLIRTNITVDIKAERHTISPYIYGINDNDGFDGVTATAIRQGGNRYTAYNWENNFSNAGSDWYHYSDTYLSSSDIPADMANRLMEKAASNNIPYRILTLQMAGFVSADNNRAVSESETAPSSRWIPVQFVKGGSFSIMPDLNDGIVYMDEYVNHLVQKYGNAASGAGINGYLLDNEPALWSYTHPRVFPQKLPVTELINRSIELSKAVKAVDASCEIFGPVLYGFSAYHSLQEAPDWNVIKTNKGYRWFLDAYLDEMRKAESAGNKRLLDALDVHYYSEAKGLCRITDCTNQSHTECHIARMQAPRTLWENGYYENSWIAQWNKSFLPILPNIKRSIDNYYPDTKLAITEYGFGGDTHISGAIAQADVLGIFGREGVYLTALWHSANNSFPNAAINLYTNYDGKGSAFGSIGVKTEIAVQERGLESNSNNELSTVYASLNNDESKLTVIVTNKSILNRQEITIKIENADISSNDFTRAVPYMIDCEGAVIKIQDEVLIENGRFTFIMPVTSVALFVIDL